MKEKEREEDSVSSEVDKPQMSPEAQQKAHGSTRWTPLLTYIEPTEESVQGPKRTDGEELQGEGII